MKRPEVGLIIQHCGREPRDDKSYIISKSDLEKVAIYTSYNLVFVSPILGTSTYLLTSQLHVLRLEIQEDINTFKRAYRNHEYVCESGIYYTMLQKDPILASNIDFHHEEVWRNAKAGYALIR